MAQVTAVTCCGVRSALAPHCARRCPQGHSPAKPALAGSQGWCVVVQVCSSRMRAHHRKSRPGARLMPPCLWTSTPRGKRQAWTDAEMC
jgi:hypothetical protein